MSKKVLAVTLGGNEYPSSNFRLRQYYPFLRADGFIVNEYNSKNYIYPKYPNIIGIRGLLRKLGYSYFYKLYELYKFKKMVKKVDIIWVNKLLRDQKLIKIVEQENKKIIVDFDDAEWLSAKVLFNSTLAISSFAIAGNKYLANYAETNFNVETQIIPTTIDLIKYPKVKKSTDDKFIIGWLGSHFTNDYLLEIKDELNDFLKKTNSEFHIISSKFDHLKPHFPNKTEFIEWDNTQYIDQIAVFNVGIMPLPNEEWVNGKCSFKMLQYMGAFVPVIVSSLGMNKEILNDVSCGFGVERESEWSNALYDLYNNKDLQIDLGMNGRKAIELTYSLSFNYEKLKNIFNKV